MMPCFLHLDTLLRKSLRSAPYALRYIITDAIFSMDGDGAPLNEMVLLAKKYNARTIVDEAHGTGVFGKNGRGWSEALGVKNKIDVIIGTSSKALGSIGGFIAGTQPLIDYIRNKSRPFIFTTALPPGSCAATIMALQTLKNRPVFKRSLWANTAYIKNQLERTGLD